MKTFLMILLATVVVAGVFTGTAVLLGFWPGMAIGGIAVAIAVIAVIATTSKENSFSKTLPMVVPPQADVAPLEEKKDEEADETFTKSDVMKLLGLSGFPGDRNRSRDEGRYRGSRRRRQRK